MRRGRLAFHWIENRATDLFWYVGSPLLGLLYLPLIFYGDRLLSVADGGARYRLDVLGQTYPVTVTFLVISSWAILLDGPHFWPTLARTFLDPDEWRRRGGVLGRSLLLFLLGPALVLTPFVIHRAAAAAGRDLPAGLARSGAPALLVVFLAWAYFHVVRQHWGFFCLYKRKAGDFDARWDRLDTWCFHLAMFLPPLLFLTGPFYPTHSPLYPNLGLHAPWLGGVAPARILHPLLWTAYLGGLAAYVASVVYRWRRGEVLNGTKLLLLATIVPVHLVAFVHPALPLFSQVLVGVGHAFQYQRIVWRYGARKYGATPQRAQRWAAFAFRNPAIYLALGLLFTLALLRGPWVEWLIRTGGRSVTRVLEALPGAAPATPGVGWPELGATVVGGLFLGWLFQHYYLDARIWRLSRDRDVRANLRV